VSSGPRIPTELAEIYYPPPPWLLHGSALVATFPVRAAAVEAFTPAPLSLMRLPGGLAMGYLGVARYVPGSTLSYSELVAGVLVRHRTRFAPYITHIGVDSEPSQRAGRELWYLPKQLWQFEWELEQPEIGVRVWDGIRLVCAISGAPANARLLPLQMGLTFLNLRGTDAATFKGDFALRMAPRAWKLQIGPDGPLVPLAPAGRTFSFVIKGAVTLHGLHVLEQ
jgi:hypothetical protein